MSWEVVEMRSFLSERIGRYKPDDKAISGLQRIDKIDFSGNIFLSKKPSRTNMILIKQGDLVISGINVEKGALSIYKGKKDVIATIHYSSYEYNPEKIDIDFLRHFLKSPEFIDALKEQVPGGIKTEIKPKHILPLKVCIPINVNEQREVVAILDRQNKIVGTQSTELTHQLDLVRQLRQAFLREAMQGRFDFAQRPLDEETGQELLEKIKAEKERLIKEKKIKKQKPLPPITEEEIPFEIPENWVWCRLGEITLYSEGGKSLKGQDVPCDKNGWGVIKTSAITRGEFLELENKTFSNTTNQYQNIKINKGDLLFCRASGSKGLAGKSCVVRTNPYSNLILSDKSIRYILSKLVSVDYVNCFNASEFGSAYYLGLGTKKSTTMNNITRSQFDNLLIPLPPLSEQKRIVAKLDELMAYCDELEASIKASQQQNELLLQQVLREALEPDSSAGRLKEKEVEKV